jgi:hypothetical protein
MQSSKTVVKTAEMLSQFDDIATAKLTSSSLAFLESETTAQTAIATFSEVLGAKPNFSRYEMARIIFVESLASEGLSEDAINQRWKRFKDQLGVDVPKSDNPESQARAKARAEATAKKRAEFDGKSIDQLKADIKNLTANASMANLKKAGEVQKEIDTRFKEENKGQEEYRKDLIKSLTEWLKEQSTNDLATMALNYGLTV